ncbi:uncharacterized protein A4U43_C03F17710 [Asparagus officinalis]|uniref:Polymerase/histidinol phosphatase N-terminal domain-containing protein n=1 Tax=Asparagus officinalis TaxID=4686 RepID=A0A5P1FAV4_ASPOF|nr:uncharacterized protein LOC109833929 [Asparagus officinalis]ONK75516.1 uncharacterized protein A4U43_C03F17710 [Asparagus officinalis]
MGDKKKKKGRGRKRVTPEQIAASRYVNRWVFGDSGSNLLDDDFVPANVQKSAIERVGFEFHSHSRCSDGFLSPSAVVERAHRNGVKVLALTDHDTVAGIPEAMDAANKFGIKIIPGVEISAVYTSRGELGTEEPVHILAYYGSCGPAKYEELDALLASIREGRHLRAQNMLLKLNKLKKTIKWEHVCKIAGNGVAPGRLHVARALVEAGHVENLKQAFSRYLYDGGPAYATGNEPMAEEVVQLICHTGGISALAHPWALKNPVSVIRSLKAAGLHAMEVYRSDGKVSGFSDLADNYGLLKLGGSDYHGRGGHDESDLGSVKLPILAVYEFLKLARPIWCNATKDILLSFANDPTENNLEKITMFGKPKNLKSNSTSGNGIVEMCLSSWLTAEEMKAVEFEAIRLKLSQVSMSQLAGVSR